MLFEGFFYANIMMGRRRVSIVIRDDFEVETSFTCRGLIYKFRIYNWSKSSKDFDYFAFLLDQRFGDQAAFGTSRTEMLPDGSMKQTTTRSQEQRLNILKYATVSVFICLEQILDQNRSGGILDYANYHCERGQKSTFEQYIHWVACRCLVQSDFRTPDASYPCVDYCDDNEEEFDASLLSSIHQM